MRDVYETLRQKEAAIERVRKEIAALKFVVPLLADDGDIRRIGESTSSIARGVSAGLRLLFRRLQALPAKLLARVVPVLRSDDIPQ